MLSENEKDARKAFYSATGKTPEDEAGDSARGLGYLLRGSLVLALLAGLFYLCH